MKKDWIAAAAVFGLGLGAANTAAAYVGPGAGLSLLGALWGLVLAVFAAVGFVVLWPLRRMFRRRRTGAGTPRREPAVEGPRGESRSGAGPS